MRRVLVGVSFGMMVLATGGVSRAEQKELPAGPIRDRYELMERVGDQAKIIGDALKSGKFDPVAAAAAKIREESARALPLFPPGSVHANSRARSEIWERWPDFEAQMRKLETRAGLVAEAARSSGDVRTAAQSMFGSCKQCHDDFRVPEKKK